MTDPKPDFDKLTDQPGKPEPAKVSVEVLRDVLAAFGEILDDLVYVDDDRLAGARAAIANARRAIADAEGQGRLGI